MLRVFCHCLGLAHYCWEYSVETVQVNVARMDVTYKTLCVCVSRLGVQCSDQQRGRRAAGNIRPGAVRVGAGGRSRDAGRADPAALGTRQPTDVEPLPHATRRQPHTPPRARHRRQTGRLSPRPSHALH